MELRDEAVAGYRRPTLDLYRNIPHSQREIDSGPWTRLQADAVAGTAHHPRPWSVPSHCAAGGAQPVAGSARPLKPLATTYISTLSWRLAGGFT
jgi:hypothetical protein